MGRCGNGWDFVLAGCWVVRLISELEILRTDDVGRRGEVGI